MKLLSFRHAGQASFGAVRDGGVVDLGRVRRDLGVAGRFRSLRELLAAGALPELRDQLDLAQADYPLEQIRYLPPIPDPEKIICIGVNYARRNEEYRDGSAPPRYPSVFMRTRESLVGHEEPLLRPPESEQMDYEGEIVIVIGKEGRRVPEHAARDYIAGFTIMNEGSIRDWLRHAKFNVTQGKNFERSGAVGPWLVSTDELAADAELRVITRVNGAQRQNDVTGSLIFPFPYLVHYLSTFLRLRPGDMIATGTPEGAGARMEPPQYLQPGDRVEVEVPGIGTLVNMVQDEAVL